MTAKTLFAAAAIALIGTTAFAGEVTEFATPTSTLTRAEVRADLARSQTANDLFAQGESYGNVQPMVLAQRAANNQVAGLSRVEVKRELARAQADGSFAQAGESYGSVVPGVSLRTRAEVRAEAIAANQDRVISQYRGM